MDDDFNSIKTAMTYLKEDISEIKEDLKEVKDILSKLDDRYVTRREFQSIKWIWGILIALFGVVTSFISFIRW